MNACWTSSDRFARSFGDRLTALHVGDQLLDQRPDVGVRRVCDEVRVRLQRPPNGRHQVVAALRAGAAQVIDGAQHVAVGEESEVGGLPAVTGR